jgi:PD-(D/E)XK nuclease superfamily
MGELTLWTGLPGSGRFQAAVEKALADAHSGLWTWWVVDSRRRAERVEQALLNEAADGVAGVSVILARQLAQHVLSSSGSTLNAISPTMRELIFRALVGESDYRDHWNPPDSAGWARKASQMYERVHGATENPVTGELLDVRVPWVRELFRRYDAWLEQHSRVDEVLLPKMAEDEIGRGIALLPDSLILDRLPEPSQSITNLLTVVSGKVTQTLVLSDHVAGVFATDAGAWVNEWVKDQNPVTTRQFPSSPQVFGFAKSVFNSPAVYPNANDTRIWFHPSEANEITHILRDAARWVHDEGLEESDLAIVCADYAGSLPRLRELAPHYGLRFDASQVWPMSARPLTALVLDLLALRTQGLERTRLISLLLNPLVRYDGKLGDNRNVLALDTAARDAGIRGGRGTFQREWIDPLRRAIDRIRIPRSIPDDPEAEERANRSAQWEADRLQAILGELGDVVTFIGELPNPCTGENVRDWVDTCLARLRVFPRTHARSGVTSELDERLTYGRLKILFENLRQMQGIGGEKRSLATWVDLIQQGLQRMTVSEPRRIRAGIPVLLPADLPGLNVKVLYVIGLTDQAWPVPPEVDLVQPFVSSSTTQLAQARSQLLISLFCAGHVRLSCPCPRTGEHKSVPSPLLLDLVAGHVGAVDDYGANDAGLDVFHSPLDLLPTIGVQLTSSSTELREVGRKRYASAATQPGPVSWPTAYHGLRVEQLRQDPASLTRYEGRLSGTAVGNAVAEQFGGAQVSPTRLDTYAQCPMRFFHKYVLSVDRVRELEDEVDPMTLGSLVHDILADTVLRLRELNGGKRVDLGVDPDQTARVICEVAEARFTNLAMPSVYWDLLVTDLLGGLIDDQRPGRLKNLLLKSVQGARSPNLVGDQITHVEASFGMPPEDGNDPLFADPLRIERGDDAVEFRGRIDRIGLHPDKGKGWRVWDYKTSEKPPATPAKMALGLKFQLPVYAWALQKALDDAVLDDTAAFDVVGYIMLSKEKVSIGGKLTAKEFAKFSDALQDRVFELRDAIKAGRYHHPLSQSEHLCTDSKYNTCPFRDACRRDHFLFRQREMKLEREALVNAYLFEFQPNLLDRREGVV